MLDALHFLIGCFCACLVPAGRSCGNCPEQVERSHVFFVLTGCDCPQGHLVSVGWSHACLEQAGRSRECFVLAENPCGCLELNILDQAHNFLGIGFLPD